MFPVLPPKSQVRDITPAPCHILDSSCRTGARYRRVQNAQPRAPAFTDAEIAILMTCLDQYKNVIGNTTSDAYSMRDKKEAWDNVTNEYEDMCLEHNIYTTRTTEQLKTCWKNVKAKYVVSSDIECFILHSRILMCIFSQGEKN
ncbi:hypothetical protein QAD02_004147 [Eretmocerus hayati]|uniref:Uncharacterized protein n=1 Tax=Eretmocerus hayati TaxID=131215 RepID=A0ACC2NPR8_9HYME|nr:hypothetical protein QAD02_004147 [Eretmocerus hayati]